jgi:predicted DNA-binding ribbon-helix-helix protein
LATVAVSPCHGRKATKKHAAELIDLPEGGVRRRSTTADASPARLPFPSSKGSLKPASSPLAAVTGLALQSTGKIGISRHQEAPMCNLFVSQDARTYQPETRALRLHGYSTSIRLEAAFWATLEEIAANEQLSLARFVGVLYDEIVEQVGNVQNFTSFLRVTCLHYLRHQELHAEQVTARLAPTAGGTATLVS